MSPYSKLLNIIERNNRNAIFSKDPPYEANGYFLIE